MKIKLNSNGQVINPPLRIAQRYIRLGRASVYEEPNPPKPKKKPKKKKIEPKEEVFESKITEEKAASQEEQPEEGC